MNISYNLSLRFKDNVSQVEKLRDNLTLIPIPPLAKSEARWDATIDKIYYSFLLLDVIHTREEVVKLITQSGTGKLQKRNLDITSKDIIGYKRALDYIKKYYLLNERLITPQDILDIAELAVEGKLTVPKETLKELCDYIQAENQHPLLQAALAQILLLRLSPFSRGNEQVAMLLSLVFLYKNAFDFRGLVTLERYWYENRDMYNQVIQSTTSLSTITPWLEYFVRTLRVQLEKTLLATHEIALGSKHPTLHHEILRPSSGSTTSVAHLDSSNLYWQLNDRQKQILSLLENPQATITNKKVQTIFKVSQITASRDLSKLVTLNLLFPHGKGRSVYYAKG